MQRIIDQLQQLQTTHLKRLSASNSSACLNLDSYRLFHGRGQCFSGLEFICVDVFQPVLLITLYAEPPVNWISEFIAKAEPWLAPTIVAVLIQHRYQQHAPTITAWGVLPDKVYAQRGPLRFLLPLAQQQNSGFFLDMEPGRCWLEQHAAKQRVLNLFAYTCAFSVVAVAAGAAKVVNVDMSSRALELGRQHHQSNHQPKDRYEFLTENILKSWGRIKRKGPFDIVIIDPPSYQPGSFVALKDYVKVVRRIPELMPMGGLVLACLNAPELGVDFIQSAFSDAGITCQLVERLAASADFPDVDPQRQLKLLVFRYEPAAIAD